MKEYEVITKDGKQIIKATTDIPQPAKPEDRIEYFTEAAIDQQLAVAEAALVLAQEKVDGFQTMKDMFV